MPARDRRETHRHPLLHVTCGGIIAGTTQFNQLAKSANMPAFYGALISRPNRGSLGGSSQYAMSSYAAAMECPASRPVARCHAGFLRLRPAPSEVEGCADYQTLIRQISNQ